MVSSPFEEVELKVCVSLLPSELGDIYGGIRRNIYQFLMRYNESVGGVLLTVSELSFEDGVSEGRIMDEMPHVHFDVKGKALVFRPKLGQVLESRVNKVTSTHVGMLVCGIFNASVASKAMGSGFHFDAIAREWRGPGGQIIAAEGVARVVVTRIHEAAGLISIEGRLPEADRERVENEVGGENVPKKRQLDPSEVDVAAAAIRTAAKKAKKRAKSIEKSTRGDV